MDDIEKFVQRQKNKPRIYGVHLALFKRSPGESSAGWYVRNKGNLATARRIHADELECIKILALRIKLP